MSTAQIPVASIERDPRQPRTVFDEAALAELADSLRERGQIQPITVRRKPGKGPARFIVVTGERRWRAAQIAGLKTLAAVVVAAKKDRLIDQIAENLQRAEMSPLELARSYRRALDDLGISPAELAKRLGIRQPFRIQEALSLLKLCPEAQSMLDSEALSRSQAWALTALPHERQLRILALLQAGKLPSEAAFKAACQTPERQVVDAPGLLPFQVRSPRTKQLLRVIEEAGAQLASELVDAERWSADINWDDARAAAEQLRWLQKTVAGLSVAAEGAVGLAAVSS